MSKIDVYRDKLKTRIPDSVTLDRGDCVNVLLVLIRNRATTVEHLSQLLSQYSQMPPYGFVKPIDVETCQLVLNELEKHALVKHLGELERIREPTSEFRQGNFKYDLSDSMREYIEIIKVWDVDA